MTVDTTLDTALETTLETTADTTVREPGAGASRDATRADTPLIPARTWAIVGASLVALSLVAIWGARALTPNPSYVSQMGADGTATANLFNAALLALAVGGLAVARATHGSARFAPSLWGISVTAALTVSGAAFVVASQVPCTLGCPIPFTGAAGIQDLVHVSAAVVGFAAAAAAMLVTAVGARGFAQRGSIAAGILVALTSGTGALMSMLGIRTDIGALLEFVAMTIAVAWLCLFAVTVASARRSAPDGCPQP